MKLLRYGPAGQERPAMLDEQGRVRDLSGFVGDFAGASVSLPVLDRLRRLSPESLPLVNNPGRIGACLASAPSFLCVGLNYHGHARELNMDVPTEPVLFSKSSSCLAGPFDPLVIPADSDKTDWEVELGVVIGEEVYDIPESEALSCVAGYCIVNDVSERSYQMDHGGQWIKGKSAPGFGPVGPWLVTPDEIDDPQALALSTTVNGETVQSSNTADMIFSLPCMISYMSHFMRLQPGDIIATGTPQGVGVGHNPPRFLRSGDVLELTIQGLGQQKTTATRAG